MKKYHADVYASIGRSCEEAEERAYKIGSYDFNKFNEKNFMKSFTYPEISTTYPDDFNIYILLNLYGLKSAKQGGCMISMLTYKTTKVDIVSMSTLQLGRMIKDWINEEKNGKKNV